MPSAYQIKNQSGLYFLTFQVVAWVDVFTRRRYKDILVESFNYCVRQKGLNVYAWCIMSNHVHCILSAKNDNLSDTIRDFKKYTSKTILEAIAEEQESRREWMLYQFKKAAGEHNRNLHLQLWTHENHAVELDTNDMIDSRLNYIHQNAVEAGYVENGEAYLYSSARDYSEEKGMIEIILLD